MKITLIGVGSFVFGPSAIHDALVEHKLHNLELALVDVITHPLVSGVNP